MKNFLKWGAILLLPFFALAQTNLTITNPVALNILKGNYAPSTYNPPGFSSLPADIVQGINNEVNPDSIKANWSKLATFFNRNSGNQLASSTRGITAAFNWVGTTFQKYSADNNNRLVVSDFTFTQSICSQNNHKETFAVLPGNSLANNSVLVFLAHADSRTSVSCPGSTVSAQGMEDNATGVALVMELARVMSKYSFKQTIVFMITTAEEQGLLGSNAFATYLHSSGVNVPVKAVLNNDIVGSLYCILPTNPVGCTVNNSIDSNSIRIFSGGLINSSSKAWARYIKMQYNENLRSIVPVKTNINIMTDIDRQNRGGDHQPFYDRGDVAARMCSFNEPGDGQGSGREHLSLDSGGIDKDQNGLLDSFFVSFTFLKRNTQINANAIAMAASAPPTPAYTVTNIGNNRLRVVVSTQTGYPAYRLMVRTTSYDFDSVYTFNRLTDTLQMPVSSNLKYYVSVASQDALGVESLFGNEITVDGTGTILAAGLIGFYGSLQHPGDIQLQWKVANTTIANKYQVERSEDGMQFTPIGVVAATSSYAYTFHDVAPLIGRSYYRLQLLGYFQNDFSQVVTIDNGNGYKSRILPTLAHNFITIKTSEASMAVITDMADRCYITCQVAEGVSINISGLLPGMYLLRIKNGEAIKFVKY